MAEPQGLAVHGHGHAFLPTRDDNVRIAIHDRLHSGCDGTQSRPADLVDAPGRYFLRYARGHGCLPCRILTLASSEHLAHRSEEHTSELQSLMRISYAVFCLKKKTHINS